MNNCKYYFFGFFLLLFVCMSSSTLCAQEEVEQLEKQKSGFGISLGIGTGIYLKDQPTVSSADIQNIKPAFSAKFYWQPPFRLRLGLETGYYPFYTTTAIHFEGSDPVNSKDQLDVVPILFHVSMRTWKELRFSIGAGPSLLFHSNESFGQMNSGCQVSFANFLVSASYLQPLTDRFSLGGEVSFFYIGETMDNQISFKVLTAYRFF